MMKLTVALRNFAKAPKMSQINDRCQEEKSKEKLLNPYMPANISRRRQTKFSSVGTLNP